MGLFAAALEEIAIVHTIHFDRIRNISACV